VAFVIILVPRDLDVRMKAVLIGALFLIVSKQQRVTYKKWRYILRLVIRNIAADLQKAFRGLINFDPEALRGCGLGEGIAPPQPTVESEKLRKLPLTVFI